jgi:hypothetical protein
VTGEAEDGAAKALEGPVDDKARLAGGDGGVDCLLFSWSRSAQLCICVAVLLCSGTCGDWACLRYPENLTVTNMLYYLAVPTLTYQVCNAARPQNTPFTTCTHMWWSGTPAPLLCCTSRT